MSEQEQKSRLAPEPEATPQQAIMRLSGESKEKAVQKVEGQVVIIHTQAPIPMDQLKRKFSENVEFVIDYDASSFKGAVFITYLTNLNLKCRLKFGSFASQLELLKEYLNSSMLVNVKEMEDLAINLLLLCRGENHFLTEDVEPFINENEEIIEVWLRRILSLMVYALKVAPNTAALVDQFPEDDNDELAGINFVKLIDHELFPFFFGNVDKSELSWNKTLFDEYCFAGQNLFHYFANPRNPLFTGLLAFAEEDGLKKLEEAANQTIGLYKEQLKGIEHVPSV